MIHFIITAQRFAIGPNSQHGIRPSTLVLSWGFVSDATLLCAKSTKLPLALLVFWFITPCGLVSRY
jgi:hypothetical protein